MAIAGLLVYYKKDQTPPPNISLPPVTTKEKRNSGFCVRDRKATTIFSSLYSSDLGRLSLGVSSAN